jgi:hypothetical protein
MTNGNPGTSVKNGCCGICDGHEHEVRLKFPDRHILRCLGHWFRLLQINQCSAFKQLLVVLENNNGFLTQLLAEGRPLCRSLPESLSASVLVSCQEVGPGEPESAAVQSVRPSAW